MHIRPIAAVLSLVLVGCPGGPAEEKDTSNTPEDSGIAVPCDEDGDSFCVSDGDCDESDPLVNPNAAEACDGIDNNCDGQVDEGVLGTYYADADSDGFGDASLPEEACEAPAGSVANADDCDDANGTVFPGAAEACDGLDNDCDGSIDEDVTTVWYEDADGDTYGNDASSVDGCESPGVGWVAVGGDCNDAEPKAWTGAAEVCDLIDNNCDGQIDEGLGTTYYADTDGDGYGDPANTATDCAGAVDGWVSNADDCNDSEKLAWTGADEYCDDVDNDCNGLVDDDAVDAVEGPADNDADGFGDPTATVWSCDPAENTIDCDDGNANEPRAVDASSTSGSPDGSMTNPYPTVQEGIDNATECVVVYAGVYSENISFNGNNVSVVGIDGSGSTTIDGGAAGSVVSFANGETAAAELTGFTLMGGSGTLEEVSETTECGSGVWCTMIYQRYYGGGVFIDGATPTLWDLVITGNELPEYSFTENSPTEWSYVYSYGGGVFASDSVGLDLDDLTITRNSALHGGGIYVNNTSQVALTHSIVAGNDADAGGGIAVVGGSFNATNVIVSNNSATAGGGFWLDAGSSTWWNAVLAANSASDSGEGVMVTGGGSATASGLVIAAHDTGYGAMVESGSSLMIEYSDLYGNLWDESGSTPGAGMLAVDPMFNAWSDDSDYSNDDLTLAAGSPLTDMGNPSSAYNDTDGSVNDIGAYGGPDGAW
ncbi:MAG: putative metal-binding motif-containing protein [Deltaproteobacteria bacterium]|nr:putative metal-binding motif-containing protein [Deltaproteobacteria bacterium]